jgi:hypothetical protein
MNKRYSKLVRRTTDKNHYCICTYYYDKKQYKFFGLIENHNFNKYEILNIIK